MSNNNAFVSPTPAEIERETLFLDAYGMEVSPIVQEHPTPEYDEPSDALIEGLSGVLAQDGWSFAGAGHFAMVFVKDGFALKIGVKPEDTGAMYAAWCRANQDLPGVPRIYGITKFTGCYLVLMKRYEEAKPHLIDADEHSPEMFAEFSAAQRALRGMPYDDDWALAQTAHKIRTFFKGVADPDLHRGNVMFDEDGNLIITDPISFGPCSGTGRGGVSYATYGYGTRY